SYLQSQDFIPRCSPAPRCGASLRNAKTAARRRAAGRSLEGCAARLHLDEGPLSIARPPARARAEQLERVGQVLEAAGDAAQAAEHAQHVVDAPVEEGPG